VRERPAILTRVRRALVLVALAAVAAAPASQQGRSGRLFPPEDLPLLEGPDRDAWQKPEQIMDALAIADGSTVADLGAGGGWFTIRLARRVGPNGLVYAEDVQPRMIESISRRVQREGLRNVKTITGTAGDPGLPEGRVDAVLIVDTYHEIEDPHDRVSLLSHVARALSPNGRVGIVDYTKEGFGPGPDMDRRVDPEQVISEAAAVGLRLLKRETFLRYQYLLVFGR
jgi:ubiquinone/menaquinone biosynthesis C-methylase UbiE